MQRLQDSATPKWQQAMPDFITDGGANIDMARTVADIKGLLTAEKAVSCLAQAAAAEEGQCVVM